MMGFRLGDKVKVREQSSSPLRGQIGTVVQTHVYGLAVVYEVSFDHRQTRLSPGNKFFEYDLEPIR